tara:strand:+ start:727 stop:1287 length:561 start_codon:yes stop_codon:yes gene_type:complete
MSKITLSSNASGTGTLTIASPNTSTDRTLTLPDETGTVLTSASPVISQKGAPAFSAYSGTTQSIGLQTYIKVLFPTERFDTTSAYDTATSRFQPNIEGYYQISSSVFTQNTNSLSVLRIFKTGALLQELSRNYAGTLAGTLTGSALVYLNGSTDYVEIYIYTGAATTVGASDEALVNFQGILVAAA